MSRKSSSRSSRHLSHRLLVSSCAFLIAFILVASAVSAADPRADLAARIEAQRDRLWQMSDWMYYNPEPGHKEFKAVELLTGYLKDNGWSVQIGLKNITPYWQPILQSAWKMNDLPTAFVATYPGQGDGPTIGIMVEYDALRGPGGQAYQGCQHNLQGPIGIGAAVALAEVMKTEGIPGKVVVFGTPAEEIPPPVKAIMYDAGVFKGVDAMIMFHGATSTTYSLPGPSMLAVDSLEFIFKGKPSHAASAPWAGRSALDAVMLFYHGIDALREHADPYYRLHGNVTDGGAAPNIVPERAATVWMVRHPKRSGVDEMTLRVKKIAEGAALMTETTVEINSQGKYDNCINVGSLERKAFGYAKAFGATNLIEPSPMPNMAAASTDFGTVSYNIPSISLSVQSAPAGIPGHSQELANATITPLAHEAIVVTAKVQANLALDLLTDPAYLAEVQAEHTKLRQQ